MKAIQCHHAGLLMHLSISLEEINFAFELLKKKKRTITGLKACMATWNEKIRFFLFLGCYILKVIVLCIMLRFPTLTLLNLFLTLSLNELKMNTNFAAWHISAFYKCFISSSSPQVFKWGTKRWLILLYCCVSLFVLVLVPSPCSAAATTKCSSIYKGFAQCLLALGDSLSVSTQKEEDTQEIDSICK